MAGRLQKMAREADPAKDVFLSRQRAEVLRAQIATNSDQQVFVNLQQSLARELLSAGQTAEALAAWQGLEDRLKEWNFPLDVRNRALLGVQKALCHMRLGEQANCVLNPTTESCLMPISPGGVHRDQRGSRAAVELLTETLRELPDNLAARWLLNIASMTLGEYPDRLPPNLVIPPSAFASDYDIKHFTNVAAGVGLELFGWAGGVVMDDFDGEGYLDV